MRKRNVSVRYAVSTMFQLRDSASGTLKGVGIMLTVALSLLFGFVAFAAIAQIYVSVGAGMRRGRQILAELAAGERVRARRLQPARPLRRPGLAAA